MRIFKTSKDDEPVLDLNRPMRVDEQNEREGHITKLKLDMGIKSNDGNLTYSQIVKESKSATVNDDTVKNTTDKNVRQNLVNLDNETEKQKLSMNNEKTDENEKWKTVGSTEKSRKMSKFVTKQTENERKGSLEKENPFAILEIIPEEMINLSPLGSPIDKLEDVTDIEVTDTYIARETLTKDIQQEETKIHEENMLEFEEVMEILDE